MCVTGIMFLFQYIFSFYSLDFGVKYDLGVFHEVCPLLISFLSISQYRAL